MASMNIAIVHDWLIGTAGAERVLEQLLQIYPEADIYTSYHIPERTRNLKVKNVSTTYLQKFPKSLKRRQILVPLMPMAFESLDLSKYDVVISNTSSVGKGVITKVETPHICYCHTPTRYIWEPHLDTRNNKSWLRRQATFKMRMRDRIAAMRPDYYIANSENIKKKIWKYYRRDSAVVFPPVNVGRFKVADKKDIKDYYLCSGRLIEYKKFDLAIKAFNDLGKPLYIIGSGPEEKKLKELAKPNIRFLGQLSDEEQAKVYREAKAYIFPANEDFGIVPIEALASGRPVIAYAAGGALESIKEGITGTFFKEQTPQCLIEAVREFNPDKYDGQRLRQAAFDFDDAVFRKNFKETVEEMLKDYKKNGPPLR